MANTTPKMTVNKLGEFLTANPARQRRILEQLKYPKENKFSSSSYSEAREAIKNYFLSGFDEQVILNCISDLEGKEATSDYQMGMISSSIEALECILDSQEISRFNDAEFLPYGGSNNKMNIKGVEVSIYPDLMLKTQSRNVEYLGGLKIHLSKSGTLSEMGAKYVAVMLYSFIEQNELQAGLKIRPDNCVSFDVFTDLLMPCPNGVKMRWNEIESGCLNIMAIWDSI